MKNIWETDKGCFAHTGQIECSLQLYLQPDLVDMKAAVWDRGVWRYPSTATKEKGERLINLAVRAVAQILRDYHIGELEDRQT